MPKKSRQRRALEAKRRKEGQAPSRALPRTEAPSPEPVAKAKMVAPTEKAKSAVVTAPLVTAELIRIGILGAILLVILLLLSRLL